MHIENKITLEIAETKAALEIAATSTVQVVPIGATPKQITQLTKHRPNAKKRKLACAPPESLELA